MDGDNVGGAVNERQSVPKNEEVDPSLLCSLLAGEREVAC
jgi:hypothetical protein